MENSHTQFDVGPGLNMRQVSEGLSIGPVKAVLHHNNNTTFMKAIIGDGKHLVTTATTLFAPNQHCPVRNSLMMASSIHPSANECMTR